ncbi:MAG: hypothetical protein FJX74_23255, partial [Armatimonadetes bacterium]|nr:hypothetical protein [Armatimonadota bacterium]
MNPEPQTPNLALARPTLRAIVLGLILTALIGVLVPYADLKLQGTWIACCHLPIAVVVPFLLLVGLVNPLLHRCSRAFTRAEVVTVYCMTLCGAGIPSFGLTEYLFPTLVGMRYYASAENRWDDAFIKLVPRWLAPADETAVTAFFEGLHPGASIPWGAWTTPVAAWTLLAAGFFLGYLCVSVLLRRQWIEEERLIFPLVQLPVQVLEVRRDDQPHAGWPPFFANRLMWIGLAVPLVVHSINGLHFFFPVVPQIPLSHSINPYFQAKPWNQMGWVIAILHFSIVGFSFLLSNELSFSLWFFFVFFNLQAVALAAYGIEIPAIPDYPTRPHAALQMLGGFLVFAGFIAFLLKRRATAVWAAASRGAGFLSAAPDADEPLSYRAALLCGATGLVIVVGWCTAAGIGPALAVV